jgi:hypothetical protein
VSSKYQPDRRTARRGDSVWAWLDGGWRSGVISGRITGRDCSVAISAWRSGHSRKSSERIAWSMLRWRNPSLSGADRPIEAVEPIGKSRTAARLEL